MDFRSAQIACILANIYRDESKHPKPYDVDDFMLSRAQKKMREQTPEDMLTIVEAINSALGGKVIESDPSLNN